MKIYKTINDDGELLPILQIDRICISNKELVKVLSKVNGVTEIIRNGFFVSNLNLHKDIKIKFNYEGVKFIVWEPFGDNSRLWIGPEYILGDTENESIADSDINVSKIF